MRAILLGFTIFTLLLSCDQKPTDKMEVDSIFYNGKVYTVNTDFSKAEAFAVKDGKFVAVGLTDSIQAKYYAKETVDLKGKTVLPGLIDAHCHF